MGKRPLVTLVLLASGLLAGILVFGALSSETGEVSSWCERYEASLQALDSLSQVDPLDADYEGAIIETQAAFNELAEVDPPGRDS